MTNFKLKNLLAYRLARTRHAQVVALSLTVLWTCVLQASSQDTQFYKKGQRIELAQFIQEIRQARVVLVGETHDRLDHHLQQLHIIREIHKAHPDIAIGLEYFQTPFQSKLDAFVAGTIETKQMLRETEYFRRWRFDYRLCEPILNFARDNKIPLVALNIPAEVTRKVATDGLDSLSKEEAARLPAIDRSDDEYREHLQQIFTHHYTDIERYNFENFYNVQLLWDEGMADTAAKHLQRFPKRKMVIVTGMGHVEYRSGIPDRLQRRLQQSVITVVPAVGNLDPDIADYVFQSQEVSLPPRGLLGLLLEPVPGNQVRTVKEDSAASSAGVRPGDIIMAIDDDPVADLTDIKISLWQKRPGDTIALQVSRASAPLTLNVVLR